MAEENGGMGGLGAAFLVGVLLGAGVALLLAPNTGSETRDLLRRKYDAVRNKISEMRQKGEVTAEEMEEIAQRM